MATRTREIDRLSNNLKASLPTIGRGNPINSQGNDGDFTFRRTSSGLKLYIKASGRWHGVKVGESFNNLEKSIEEIKSTLRTMDKFRLPSTYDVIGDFTLDVSGDIELNADGGQVTIKDDTASHFEFDCDATTFTMYDDTAATDYLRFRVAANGASTISTNDNDGTAGNLTLDVDGDIELNADGGNVSIKDGADSHFEFSCDSTRMRMLDDTSSSDYLELLVAANGESTISTVDNDGAAGHLNLAPNGYTRIVASNDAIMGLNVDANYTGTTTDARSGIYNDIDQTGIVASGQSLVLRGLDNRINTNAPTMVGTVTAYGINNEVTCGTSGTQSAYGIYNTVTGADDNIGLYINAPSGGNNLAIKIVSSANENDYCYMTTRGEGDTIIGTVDADTTSANITLAPDGDLILDPASQKTIINATDGLYFDGGVDTYISEVSADTLRLYVGGDILIHAEENGADGNQVYFSDASVGFTQLEPTYGAITTTVDFRLSNKQNLTFGAGNITNLNVIFPAMSGNFQLLIKQDGTGSRTVTNWKARESDESAADGVSTVVWAGGSNPTLTTDANHVDILSFYWDNDNEIAYGVSTLDFQF